jgi:hypothetical protein
MNGPSAQNEGQPDFPDTCRYCGDTATYDVENRLGTGTERYATCAHHRAKPADTTQRLVSCRQRGAWALALGRLAGL